MVVNDPLTAKMIHGGMHAWKTLTAVTGRTQLSWDLLDCLYPQKREALFNSTFR